KEAKKGRRSNGRTQPTTTIAAPIKKNGIPILSIDSTKFQNLLTGTTSKTLNFGSILFTTPRCFYCTYNHQQDEAHTENRHWDKCERRNREKYVVEHRPEERPVNQSTKIHRGALQK
ncbi:hypothetical protein, partial [Rhodococcus rhodochrous]|uniref:hypothetical protein n=1 Tax=Rhodococcus rhodochrous TaxID=1829 RepID=UPI001E321878